MSRRVDPRIWRRTVLSRRQRQHLRLLGLLPNVTEQLTLIQPAKGKEQTCARH